MMESLFHHLSIADKTGKTYSIAICYHLFLYMLTFLTASLFPKILHDAFLQLLCLANYQRCLVNIGLVFCELHALLSASAIALGLSSHVASGCETLKLASLSITAMLI